MGHVQGELVRFRITGRSYFGIAEDVDLAEPPYVVDLDAMNVELAQLVNALQGGIFLATGDGVDPSGRRVTALLWPLDVASKSAANPAKEEHLFATVVGAAAR